MKRIFLSLLFGFGVFFLIALLFPMLSDQQLRKSSRLLAQTWHGYKSYFVRPDGAVYNPQGQEVTSEGQANAMLRAVVMGDQKTFERILQWTNDNLSRAKTSGDHLLSWHYKDGHILDPMPATDADIDYALALIFASYQWKDSSYADMAKVTLKDILGKLTTVFRYRRYLLPWMIDPTWNQDNIPQNLSYYSPAYFKFFYTFDHDPRWLELVDTAYTLMLQTQLEFNGIKGVGLIPDWSMIDRQGRLHGFEGKSLNSSWEAVRVPLRIGVDAFFYRDPRAIEVLQRFAHFAENELKAKNKLVSEYSYDGKALSEEESPLFYAASYVAFDLTNNQDAASWSIDKLHQELHWSLKGSYYQSSDKYYLNSLAWIADLLNRERIHDKK